MWRPCHYGSAICYSEIPAPGRARASPVGRIGDHNGGAFYPWAVTACRSSTCSCLLLTVAVGSNYCLFFERQAKEGETRERTLASLVLANCCTVIGFGVLSFSGIPVLHGIGGTVAVGAFLSLIFGAILITQPQGRT